MREFNGSQHTPTRMYFLLPSECQSEFNVMNYHVSSQV